MKRDLTKSKMTKDIFFDTKAIHQLTLDCEPDTDFVEFYVDCVYITKINVNKLSKEALRKLQIRTEPAKDEN